MRGPFGNTTPEAKETGCDYMQLYESQMKDAVAKYPEELLGEPGLKLISRQHHIGNYVFDLLFEDRHGGKLIVELQRGTLDRGHCYKIFDYVDEYRAPNRPEFVDVIVVASAFTDERKKQLTAKAVKFLEIREDMLIQFLERRSECLDRRPADMAPIAETDIRRTLRKNTGLSRYQEFSRQLRLKNVPMEKIAKLWNKAKGVIDHFASKSAKRHSNFSDQPKELYKKNRLLEIGGAYRAHSTSKTEWDICIAFECGDNAQAMKPTSLGLTFRMLLECKYTEDEIVSALNEAFPGRKNRGRPQRAMSIFAKGRCRNVDQYRNGHVIGLKWDRYRFFGSGEVPKWETVKSGENQRSETISKANILRIDPCVGSAKRGKKSRCGVKIDHSKTITLADTSARLCKQGIEDHSIIESTTLSYLKKVAYFHWSESAMKVIRRLGFQYMFQIAISSPEWLIGQGKASSEVLSEFEERLQDQGLPPLGTKLSAGQGEALKRELEALRRHWGNRHTTTTAFSKRRTSAKPSSSPSFMAPMKPNNMEPGTPLHTLKWTPRAVRTIEALGVTTIGELAELRKDEVENAPNAAARTVTELGRMLARFGFAWKKVEDRHARQSNDTKIIQSPSWTIAKEEEIQNESQRSPTATCSQNLSIDSHAASDELSILNKILEDFDL